MRGLLAQDGVGRWADGGGADGTVPRVGVCSGVVKEWCRKLISFKNKKILLNHANSVLFILESSSSSSWAGVRISKVLIRFLSASLLPRVSGFMASEQRSRRRGGGDILGEGRWEEVLRSGLQRYQSFLTFLFLGDLRRTSSSNFYRRKKCKVRRKWRLQRCQSWF